MEDKFLFLFPLLSSPRMDSIVSFYLDKYGDVVRSLYSRNVWELLKSGFKHCYFGYELEVPLVEAYRVAIYDARKLLELFHVGYDRSGVAELDTPPIAVPIEEEEDQNIKAVFTGLALTGFQLCYTLPISDRLIGLDYGRHFHLSFPSYPPDKLKIMHRLLPCLKPLLTFRKSGVLQFRNGVKSYAVPTWSPDTRDENSRILSMTCINKRWNTYEVRLPETSILETYATAHILYTVYLEPKRFEKYLPVTVDELVRIVMSPLQLIDPIHTVEGKKPLAHVFTEIVISSLEVLKSLGLERSLRLVKSVSEMVLHGRYIYNLLELLVPTLVASFVDVELNRLLHELTDSEIKIKLLSIISTRPRR